MLAANANWRLTDARGLPVVDPATGATTFTVEAAIDLHR